jgi:hypothetical protein
VFVICGIPTDAIHRSARHDYKKNFRAPATRSNRPQLLAAAPVASILPHRTFSRGKNLGILFLKVWFEIFR